MGRCSTSNRSKRGQALIMFSLMVSAVLIPMVGLAIDGGRGYLVKLKLSSAVDGGALAAARLLGTGTDVNAQVNNAKATVGQFVAANFPAKFFGADISGTPDVCVDPGSDNSDPCKVNSGASGVNTFKVRTIVVSATARMPTFFMGLLGMPNVTVSARGVAARRDVRVVLVMDRSSSMSGWYTGVNQSPPSIQDYALKFVTSFSGSTKSGRDEMGLVVYGGSGIIAYPPRKIATDYTDYTKFSPPDKDFGGATKMPQNIAKLKGGSNTGTAEALYLAYMMLRADSNSNTELANKLNVIVLFTDGVPNGVTAFANDPNLIANPTVNYVMKAGGGCTNVGNANVPAPVPLVSKSGTNNNMIGWFAQWGGSQAGNTGSSPHGFFTPMMAFAYTGYTGAGDDIDMYMANPNKDSVLIPQANASAGCTFSGTDLLTSPMSHFPLHDLYGNWTDLNGAPAVGGATPPKGGAAHLYELGDLYKNTGQCNKNGFNNTNTKDACQIALASWQAAAHQAWKIWNQIIWDQKTETNIADPGTYLSQPVIFTIGFDNGNASDKADHTLLRMIANDVTSPVSFSSRINGNYYYADGPTAVDYAFQQISSQILRLSQ